MIQIEFVRIKSSQFDYHWERTRENIDELFDPTHTEVHIDYTLKQYFELEEEEQQTEEKEEKLPDNHAEQNLNNTSEFHDHSQNILSESDDNDYQEPDDFWDRLQQELEEQYGDGSDYCIQMEQYETDMEKSDGFDVGVHPLVTLDGFVDTTT